MLPSPFRTVVEALMAAPSERPFITMWENEDVVQTVTFGEFRTAAERQAQQLEKCGLSRLDRVVLIMPQGIPLMTNFAAVMLLGATPSILAYPNFKTDPVKYSSGLAGVSANLKARLVVVDDAFPSEVLDSVTLAEDTQIVRSSDSVGSCAALPLRHLELEPDTLAFIQHSAGTTGLQKGVALSHQAVLTQISHLADALQLTDRDRIYSWLPLYHDMGLITSFILPLVYHLPVVMESPVDWVIRPATMLQLISEYQCTLAWVPNFALQFLARRVRVEDRAQFHLASLRSLINCSEPVRAESMEEFHTAYIDCGLKRDALKSSYAMAENVFAVTQSDAQAAPRQLWVDQQELLARGRVLPTEEHARGSIRLVSSGRCLAGNRVRVLSSSGTALPDGEVGELAIQSDSLFDGYYNRPDLTAKVFERGWYRSGDLGFTFGPDVYVLGRHNDLIIVAGRNIHPQDVEEIVCRHPAIHDGRAVALGLYDEQLGTEGVVVAAEVESEIELSNALEIERALRDALVSELDITIRRVYLKPPRWIVKSTAGKPARSTTREKLLAEHPELRQDSRSVEQNHECRSTVD
jgi:acyl-CoA synthetase (AMP-forming)/AMP-acid ligase II